MAGKNELGKALIELKNRVTDRFNESDWKELGTLLDQYDVIRDHGRLLRSMAFGDNDYEGAALDVIRKLAGSDGANIGAIQEFLESKYPEGENVSNSSNTGRKIVFVPGVFQVPDEGVDDRLISVMMPFAGNFTPVYDAIKKAAGEVGMKCLRVDDIWEASTVIQDVFSLIFRARIVVCDYSTKNANVFYEAGIAHTLGKEVVPIAQSGNDVPFDVQHHRYLHYLNNAEGRDALCNGLVKRFAKILE